MPLIVPIPFFYSVPSDPLSPVRFFRRNLLTPKFLVVAPWNSARYFPSDVDPAVPRDCWLPGGDDSYELSFYDGVDDLTYSGDGREFEHFLVRFNSSNETVSFLDRSVLRPKPLMTDPYDGLLVRWADVELTTTSYLSVPRDFWLSRTRAPFNRPPKDYPESSNGDGTTDPSSTDHTAQPVRPPPQPSSSFRAPYEKSTLAVHLLNNMLAPIYASAQGRPPFRVLHHPTVAEPWLEYFGTNPYWSGIPGEQFLTSRFCARVRDAAGSEDFEFMDQVYSSGSYQDHWQYHARNPY